MKRIPCLWLSLALFLPAPSQVLADLTVVQVVDQGGQKMEMTMKSKGDKMLADTGMGMATLFDGATGDMVTLMHSQKKVMRIPAAMLEKMSGMMPGADASKTEPAAVKFEPTGRKETIGGHACEEYLVQGAPEGEKVSIWVAPNHPKNAAMKAMYKSMGEKMKSAPAAAMMAGQELPGVPMKVEMTPKSGPVVLIELREINEDPIPDSVFEIPADYTEMQVPGM